MGEHGLPLSSAGTPVEGRLRGLFRQTAGYLIAAACLAWLFYDVHPREILRSAARLHWGWVALAIVFDVLSYLCQGWRWQLLLRPIGEISATKAAQAIYAGLFTNEVVPLRVGELVRTYLVSRWIPAPFAKVIPSLVVERLFDGIWLAVCIGLTAIFVPLPKNLLEASDVLGATVLLGTIGFAFFLLRARKAAPEPAAESGVGWKPLRILKTLLGHIEDGLRAIGLTGSFWAAFGLSLVFLLGQILAFWLIMLACGLWLSFWIGTVVLLVVHLGTAVPNAPANVGTYQFFTVLGLSLFGVDKATATGFSFVVFFLLTVPLWVLGLTALSRSGMTLSSIRREIRGLAL